MIIDISSMQLYSTWKTLDELKEFLYKIERKSFDSFLKK